MEVLAVVLLVGVAVVAVVAVRRAMGGGSTSRRRFDATPASLVAEVGGPGVRRLTGTVRAIGVAPVSEASGRPYVARDLRIVASDGSSSAPSRPASQAVDFLLDDGSGLALVRASAAVVALDRDVEAPRTTLDQVPWVDELLRAGGYRNGSPATCRIRVSEGVLGPGDPVAVVGHVEPVDPADPEATALGARVVVRPDGTQRVLVRRSEAESPGAGAA